MIITEDVFNFSLLAFRGAILVPIVNFSRVNFSSSLASRVNILELESELIVLCSIVLC